MIWFKDGYRNTKFFHAQVNRRRRRLPLSIIQNSYCQWLEGNDEMAEEAVKYFKAQFKEERFPTDFGIINYVPTMVTQEQNQELVIPPTTYEVKQVIFWLNGESAGGPDGFSGNFFQSCWDIIGDDIADMVKAFLNGQQLPKFVTHTNLVLFPKKKEVHTFSYMRPISLSNFINKIFSRVIHERLVDIYLISFQMSRLAL